jgi:predicted secreted hydrolase
MSSNSVIQTFTYTGVDQIFTVPFNITGPITFYVWGAGGGSSSPASLNTGVGGGGGFQTGTFNATPSDNVKIIVGQGGLYNNTSKILSYGGGGYGGGSSPNLVSGGGGGRSGIIFNGIEILTCGGGGGGGQPSPVGFPGNGGASYGDGTTSQGGLGEIPGGGGGSSGGPGTSNSVNGPNQSSTPGQKYIGGNGGFNNAGGGGGGGYYGGGGADAQGGGGGGGSFYDSSKVTIIRTGNENGNTYNPGGKNTQYYQTGVGVGGYGFDGILVGGNGLIVLQYLVNNTGDSETSFETTITCPVVNKFTPPGGFVANDGINYVGIFRVPNDYDSLTGGQSVNLEFNFEAQYVFNNSQISYPISSDYSLYALNNDNTKTLLTNPSPSYAINQITYPQTVSGDSTYNTQLTTLETIFYCISCPISSPPPTQVSINIDFDYTPQINNILNFSQTVSLQQKLNNPAVLAETQIGDPIQIPSFSSFSGNLTFSYSFLYSNTPTAPGSYQYLLKTDNGLSIATPNYTIATNSSGSYTNTYIFNNVQQSLVSGQQIKIFGRLSGGSVGFIEMQFTNININYIPTSRPSLPSTETYTYEAAVQTAYNSSSLIVIGISTIPADYINNTLVALNFDYSSTISAAPVSWGIYNLVGGNLTPIITPIPVYNPVPPTSPLTIPIFDKTYTNVPLTKGQPILLCVNTQSSNSVQNVISTTSFIYNIDSTVGTTEFNYTAFSNTNLSSSSTTTIGSFTAPGDYNPALYPNGININYAWGSVYYVGNNPPGAMTVNLYSNGSQIATTTAINLPGSGKNNSQGSGIFTGVVLSPNQTISIVLILNSATENRNISFNVNFNYYGLEYYETDAPTGLISGLVGTNYFNYVFPQNNWSTTDDIVQLPRDDGVVNEIVQWWYWTGHLTSTDNSLILGYEISFFTVFDSGNLVQCAITDVTNNEFYYSEHLSTEPPNIIPNGFNLVADNGIASAVGGNGNDHIEFTAGPYSININLTQGKPTTIHYGGQRHYYNFGGNTKYYSRTEMPTSGTITNINTNTTKNITGNTWFDRQYGSLILAIIKGWQWFAIELDNNTEITLFDFNGDDKSENMGSFTAADGTNFGFSPTSFTVTDIGVGWTSPHSNCVYPNMWQVTFPIDASGTLSPIYIITPQVADQELIGVDSPTYWEGTCNVYGITNNDIQATINAILNRTATPIGKCYTELNGYCPHPNTIFDLFDSVPTPLGTAEQMAIGCDRIRIVSNQLKISAINTLNGKTFYLPPIPIVNQTQTTSMSSLSAGDVNNIWCLIVDSNVPNTSLIYYYNGLQWNLVDQPIFNTGSTKLVTLSVGFDGVCIGIDNQNLIWTYQFQNNWFNQTMDSSSVQNLYKATQISVGTINYFWGIYNNNSTTLSLYLDGGSTQINLTDPIPGGAASNIYITLCYDGTVWLLNNGLVYQRLGISMSRPEGTSWAIPLSAPSIGITSIYAGPLSIQISKVNPTFVWPLRPISTVIYALDNTQSDKQIDFFDGTAWSTTTPVLTGGPFDCIAVGSDGSLVTSYGTTINLYLNVYFPRNPTVLSPPVPSSGNFTNFSSLSMGDINNLWGAYSTATNYYITYYDPNSQKWIDETNGEQLSQPINRGPNPPATNIPIPLFQPGVLPTNLLQITLPYSIQGNKGITIINAGITFSNAVFQSQPKFLFYLSPTITGTFDPTFYNNSFSYSIPPGNSTTPGWQWSGTINTSLLSNGTIYLNLVSNGAECQVNSISTDSNNIKLLIGTSLPSTYQWNYVSVAYDGTVFVSASNLQSFYYLSPSNYVWIPYNGNIEAGKSMISAANVNSAYIYNNSHISYYDGITNYVVDFPTGITSPVVNFYISVCYDGTVWCICNNQLYNLKFSSEKFPYEKGWIPLNISGTPTTVKSFLAMPGKSYTGIVDATYTLPYYNFAYGINISGIVNFPTQVPTLNNVLTSSQMVWGISQSGNAYLYNNYLGRWHFIGKADTISVGIDGTMCYSSQNNFYTGSISTNNSSNTIQTTTGNVFNKISFEQRSYYGLNTSLYLKYLSYVSKNNSTYGISNDNFLYQITPTNNAFKYINKNIFIAVGRGDNFNIAYSYDGINWTGAPNSVSIFPGGISDVCTNGAIFVAAGNYHIGKVRNCFAYSYDGINWLPSPTQIFPDYSGTGRCVYWDGTKFLGGGFVSGYTDTSPIAYSYDGINWVPCNALNLNFYEVQGIAWNGNTYVAAGRSPFFMGNPRYCILNSSDGITWTKNISVVRFSVRPGGTCVCWNGKVFVVGGSIYGTEPSIIYSSDGISWNDANTKTLNGSEIFHTCFNIIWNGTQFIANGYGYGPQPFIIATSVDGITWTAQILEFPVAGICLNQNLGLYVGGGSGQYSIKYSYDGSNWTGVSNSLNILKGCSKVCTYTPVPNQSISTGFDGTLMGTDVNNTVYIYDPIIFRSWQIVYRDELYLNQIAVANSNYYWGVYDAGLFSIPQVILFYNGYIYNIDAPIVNNPIYSAYVSVSYDGTVWALYNNKLYQRIGMSNSKPQGLNWILMAQSLIDEIINITTGPGPIGTPWGSVVPTYKFPLLQNSNILFSSPIDTYIVSVIQGIPSVLTNLSLFNSNWTQTLPYTVPSTATTISIGCDNTFLYSDATNVYIRTNFFSGNPGMSWYLHSSLPTGPTGIITFTSLSVGDLRNIWAVGSDTNLYNYSLTNKSWTKTIPSSPLKSVSIGQDQSIFGITTDNYLFFVDTSSGNNTKSSIPAIQVCVFTQNYYWYVLPTTFSIIVMYNNVQIQQSISPPVNYFVISGGSITNAYLSVSFDTTVWCLFTGTIDATGVVHYVLFRRDGIITANDPSNGGIPTGTTWTPILDTIDPYIVSMISANCGPSNLTQTFSYKSNNLGIIPLIPLVIYSIPFVLAGIYAIGDAFLSLPDPKQKFKEVNSIAPKPSETKIVQITIGYDGSIFQLSNNNVIFYTYGNTEIDPNPTNYRIIDKPNYGNKIQPDIPTFNSIFAYNEQILFACSNDGYIHYAVNDSSPGGSYDISWDRILIPQTDGFDFPTQISVGIDFSIYFITNLKALYTIDNGIDDFTQILPIQSPINYIKHKDGSNVWIGYNNLVYYNFASIDSQPLTNMNIKCIQMDDSYNVYVSSQSATPSESLSLQGNNPSQVFGGEIFLTAWLAWKVSWAPKNDFTTDALGGFCIGPQCTQVVATNPSTVSSSSLGNTVGTIGISTTGNQYVPALASAQPTDSQAALASMRLKGYVNANYYKGTENWTGNAAPGILSPESQYLNNFNRYSFSFGLGHSGGGSRASSTSLGFCKSLYNAGYYNFNYFSYTSSNSGGGYTNSKLNYQPSTLNGVNTNPGCDQQNPVPINYMLGNYYNSNQLTSQLLINTLKGKARISYGMTLQLGIFSGYLQWLKNHLIPFGITSNNNSVTRYITTFNNSGLQTILANFFKDNDCTQPINPNSVYKIISRCDTILDNTTVKYGIDNMSIPIMVAANNRYAGFYRNAVFPMEFTPSSSGTYRTPGSAPRNYNLKTDNVLFSAGKSIDDQCVNISILRTNSGTITKGRVEPITFSRANLSASTNYQPLYGLTTSGNALAVRVPVQFGTLYRQLFQPNSDTASPTVDNTKIASVDGGELDNIGFQPLLQRKLNHIFQIISPDKNHQQNPDTFGNISNLFGTPKNRLPEGFKFCLSVFPRYELTNYQVVGAPMGMWDYLWSNYTNFGVAIATFKHTFNPHVESQNVYGYDDVWYGPYPNRIIPFPADQSQTPYTPTITWFVLQKPSVVPIPYTTTYTPTLSLKQNAFWKVLNKGGPGVPQPPGSTAVITNPGVSPWQFYSYISAERLVQGNNYSCNFPLYGTFAITLQEYQINALSYYTSSLSDYYVVPWIKNNCSPYHIFLTLNGFVPVNYLSEDQLSPNFVPVLYNSDTQNPPQPIFNYIVRSVAYYSQLQKYIICHGSTLRLYYNAGNSLMLPGDLINYVGQGGYNWQNSPNSFIISVNNADPIQMDQTRLQIDHKGNVFIYGSYPASPVLYVNNPAIWSSTVPNCIVNCSVSTFSPAATFNSQPPTMLITSLHQNKAVVAPSNKIYLGTGQGNPLSPSSSNLWVSTDYGVSFSAVIGTAAPGFVGPPAYQLPESWVMSIVETSKQYDCNPTRTIPTAYNDTCNYSYFQYAVLTSILGDRAVDEEPLSALQYKSYLTFCTEPFGTANLNTNPFYYEFSNSGTALYPTGAYCMEYCYTLNYLFVIYNIANTTLSIDLYDCSTLPTIGLNNITTPIRYINVATNFAALTIPAVITNLTLKYVGKQLLLSINNNIYYLEDVIFNTATNPATPTNISFNTAPLYSGAQGEETDNVLYMM